MASCFRNHLSLLLFILLSARDQSSVDRTLPSFTSEMHSCEMQMMLLMITVRIFHSPMSKCITPSSPRSWYFVVSTAFLSILSSSFLLAYCPLIFLFGPTLSLSLSLSFCPVGPFFYSNVHPSPRSFFPSSFCAVDFSIQMLTRVKKRHSPTASR